MLVTTVVIDAQQTMREAMARIESLPDDAYVIVRRRDGTTLYWYQHRAGFIREMGEHTPEARVIDALNLHEFGATTTWQVDAIPLGAATPEYGVVLDGVRPVGVLTGEAGAITRRIAEPIAAGPPMGVGADFPGDMAGDAPMGDGGDAGGGGWPRTVEVGDGMAGDEPGTPDDLGPVDLPEPEPPVGEATFSAFPTLECPATVAVGDTFDLVVGLTGTAQRDTAGGAIRVDTALPEFDLVVQIVADGFTVERMRDVLHVVRSDLAANEVRFALTAEPIEGQIRPAILQVDFSFGGVLCGRAWRAVAVTADGGAGALVGEPPTTMSTPVMVAGAEAAPDLVITITENDDSTQLEWQFTTPHAQVALPETPVRKRFRAHNAKSFAMQQIRLADRSPGAAAVGNQMLGIARTIADEIPPEAWRVLAAVWTAARATGELPSVLLVSTDPYIPWELASTEAAYIDEDLVDDALPLFLGAQTRISRWTAPQPRGAGAVLNPPLPPPSRVDMDRMALVVGDYLAESGVRPLPKAVEEGNLLAARYGAIRLTATLDEVDPLFDGTLEHDGARVDPDVVHFACHGQIDPNNPGFNGIVLNKGNQRLDPIYVAGSRMERPFVFLNACQIGQATELLDDAGGMAAEFLKTGASGFVAPLWSVDDQVAQDTAVGFYREALDEGVPVAEVLRRRRAQFDADAETPQTTHLAYVYYGHPRLLLSRAE